MIETLATESLSSKFESKFQPRTWWPMGRGWCAGGGGGGGGGRGARVSIRTKLEQFVENFWKGCSRPGAGLKRLAKEKYGSIKNSMGARNT